MKCQLHLFLDVEFIILNFYMESVMINSPSVGAVTCKSLILVWYIMCSLSQRHHMILVYLYLNTMIWSVHTALQLYELGYCSQINWVCISHMVHFVLFTLLQENNNYWTIKALNDQRKLLEMIWYMFIQLNLHSWITVFCWKYWQSSISKDRRIAWSIKRKILYQ